MFPSAVDVMTGDEKRAGMGLAAIFALRMLGLFLVLPVLAVHARGMPGGQDLRWVGLALGAYGLTQAVLQIAFGAASDRLGRKPVIVVGLLIFALGSFVAALAPDVFWIIVGRALQGAGAISAAVMALAADLTREQHRTKVMAMIGSSIGIVFALSLAIAPLLYRWLGMTGIFGLTGLLALGAVLVLYYVVPQPPVPAPRIGNASAWQLLCHPQLSRLNFGIFTLHLVQMAMFVVVPAALVQGLGLPVSGHWQVYLPVVVLSFVLMVPAIVLAERRQRMRFVFNGAIVLVLLSQIGLGLFAAYDWALLIALCLFFTGFNVLEASLPSLISRIAPAHAKGLALGLYNTTQALGLFAGGALGGLLAHSLGAHAVYLLCVVLALVWLWLGLSMNFPPARSA